MIIAAVNNKIDALGSRTAVINQKSITFLLIKN